MNTGAAGPDKIYDVTAQEREVIEWRAQRRAALRLEYLKERHNPDPTDHIFDPGYQRFYSANFAYEKLFKPTVKNAIYTVLMTVGVISITTLYVWKDRRAKEISYRTGQVSYHQRDWKFG